jgi:hypothetical protein
VIQVYLLASDSGRLFLVAKGPESRPAADRGRLRTIFH